MWYPRFNFSASLRCGVFLFAVTLTGCGDFCITGFSNNGNGMINVTASNPPPACSLPHVNGMMRAVALKTRVCETCPATQRAQHVFVTLQGIQLRPETPEDSPSGWVEIAPQLASEPRQIDLIDDLSPEILAGYSVVPEGSYREVRLQFLADDAAGGKNPALENRCGKTGWNCVVTASGQVEPLRLPGPASELLIPLQDAGANSFLVLPDSKTELRLSLQPRHLLYLSAADGWKPQFLLSGTATIERRETDEARMSSLD